MERERLVKLKFSAYMSIMYKTPKMEAPVECILNSVDFDAETMNLTPFDEIYEKNDFTANAKYCELKRPEPKLSFKPPQP